MRYRLDVVAPTVPRRGQATRAAGSYDRVMAGWDVTVLIAVERGRLRPLQILGVRDARPGGGARGCGRTAPTRRPSRSPPICSTSTRGYSQHVRNALEQGTTEVTLWGERLARRAGWHASIPCSTS